MVNRNLVRLYQSDKLRGQSRLIENGKPEDTKKGQDRSPHRRGKSRKLLAVGRSDKKMAVSYDSVRKALGFIVLMIEIGENDPENEHDYGSTRGSVTQTHCWNFLKRKDRDRKKRGSFPRFRLPKGHCEITG